VPEGRLRDDLAKRGEKIFFLWKRRAAQEHGAFRHDFDRWTEGGECLKQIAHFTSYLYRAVRNSR
jgi:hypothetical protein